MNMVTIIGRGHSGTRAISHTLTASGFFMGANINESGDLVPGNDMYEACRVMARHVKHPGGLEWDFRKLHTMPIDPAFTRLIESYLASVLTSSNPNRGWKIPETTLVFPWIVRMFPDIKYIFWIRNPRDCILGRHLTDDLSRFGVAYPPVEGDQEPDVRRRRAISWKYQYDLVKATPKPKRWIELRLEDFVLHQDQTLAKAEALLGVKLAKIAVKPETVGRWKTDAGPNYFDFLKQAMTEFRYDIPDASYCGPKGASC
ncbi:MAG: sulfotransferase [Phycisphaeraceae bacterium]|nr:sulfotransferase [Phycisphaeraceae bacterium]